MRIDPSLYSFSFSEMETYKQCKRKWWLQYYVKLRRRSAPRNVARDSGIIVHAALHNFYMAGGLEGVNSEEIMYQSLQAVRDEDMLKVEEADREKVTKAYDIALILCKGYVEWLRTTGADIGFNFDRSEHTYSAPGPVEGSELLGIVDLGGEEERSGDLFVMDTKVTDSIDTMVKTLHISEQGPMYAILARLNDPNPDRGFRVIWNMIKRSQQTKTARPPFYVRYELAINADQLKQYYGQLQGQIEDIFETERKLNHGVPHQIAAYPNPGRDCTWKCPYFNICGSLSDPRTDSDYLINVYFSTPEERAAAKLDEEANLLTHTEGE